MMRVWITCFVLLFGATELLQWIKQFSLPLPIFILGGVFLAIASNYDKLSHLPFHLDYEPPEPPQKEVAAAQTPVMPQPATPPKTPIKTPASSQAISFTIRKPHHPGD